MASATAGYSGTPISKKLGMKPSLHVFLIGAPRGFRALLKPLPDGVTFSTDSEPPHTFVHLFARSLDDLDRLRTLREELEPEGTIWVSWPKQSSGVKSDVTENAIRDAALPLGLVDVKVCAVDATWSALKLVIRKSERVRTK